ncbi:amidohydrolase family protein [uncultured Methylobacterium sp.]|uniref:amidohydrolase family protein n=1 Tax=uncultured Methylobacterium sp. TaxID=157278 RepID=UPI0035CA855A
MLIRGGMIVSAGFQGAVRKDIVVENGLIESVSEPGAVEGADFVEHDATDRLITPGFVNAHTHGHANLMKGVAEAWTLEASLTHGLWLGGARNAETVYVSTLLGALDMISKGCTSCFDLVYEFPLPTKENFWAAAAAYRDAGMRAVLAPMVADRHLLQAIPGLIEALPSDLRDEAAKFSMPPRDATMAAVETIVRSRADLPSGIALALAPTIPHHCSEGFLTDCRDVAAGHGLPIQMHVAESRLQAVAAGRSYGCSAVRHLAKLGILSPNFTAAHGVWLNADDLDVLAAHGCSVAHMPASNFRLGSGLAQIRPMLDRGINVGLGTDGANSSDALSMMEAMRLASYGARAIAGSREDWLRAPEILSMATEGGARALGRDDGRIAPGAPADLTFFDLGHIDFLPANDPVNQIVTCADSSSVTDVMTAGEFRLRRRKFTSLDCVGLREKVVRNTLRLSWATDAMRKLAGRLEPHVVAFADALASEPVGMERHVRAGAGA